MAWPARAHVEAGRWGEAHRLLEGQTDPVARALSARILAWIGRHDEARGRARALLADASVPGAARALATAALADAAGPGPGDASRLALREAAVALVAEPDAEAVHADLLLDASAAATEADPAHASRLFEAAEAAIERQGLLGLALRLEALRWLLGSGADQPAELARLSARAEAAGQVKVAYELLELTRARLVRAHRAVPQAQEEARLALRERIALSLPPALRARFIEVAAEGARGAAVDRGGRPAPSEAYDPRLARLLATSKRLALEDDLERLLERITESAVDLAGAERGLVLRVEGGGLRPVLVHGAPFPPGDPAIGFSRSIAEAVLIDGEPIMTVDARHDERLADYLSVHRLALRSVACLPIRAPSGVMGVLYLEHRFESGRFAERDMALLMAFADQAGVALARTERLATLAAREAELEEKTRALLDAKAELERVLAAREVELTGARREVARAREALTREYGHYGIVGRSDAIRRAMGVVERVAASSVPVVIRGESGTGKELAARALHAASPRASSAFVAINCAAVPDGILESELFGHVRGAFTGAHADRAGVFAQANGGTLFLDEIGDMPQAMQVKLLRVLQDGKITPVGGVTPVDVDVRVVCATQRPLGALVEEGRFRADLYYRLHVIEVELPPLRKRREDIPPLVEHLLGRIAEREGGVRRRLSRRSMAALLVHPLPGNVRQLEHLLVNAYLLTSGDELEVFEPDLAGPADPAAPPSVPPEADAATPPGAPREGFAEFKEGERSRILGALEATAWNRAEAARRIGMPRRTFYRRLKEHGIK